MLNEQQRSVLEDHELTMFAVADQQASQAEVRLLVRSIADARLELTRVKGQRDKAIEAAHIYNPWSDVELPRDFDKARRLLAEAKGTP